MLGTGWGSGTHPHVRAWGVWEEIIAIGRPLCSFLAFQQATFFSWIVKYTEKNCTSPMTFPNFISKTWNLPWSISVYQSLNLDMTGLVKQVTQVATLLFDFLFISDSLGCLLWWWLWWWSVEIHTSSSFLSFKAPSSEVNVLFYLNLSKYPLFGQVVILELMLCTEFKFVGPIGL